MTGGRRTPLWSHLVLTFFTAAPRFSTFNFSPLLGFTSSTTIYH
jgi:hypothetical protein